MDADAQPLVFHPVPPEGVTRRRALAWMAASAALAATGCTPASRERIHPWVQMPEAGLAHQPLFYASAVLRDGHAMGVLVATQEGRPVKIEGNPAHPASLGATDVFAQAEVLQLWDPDRSQAVMQRLDPQGAAAAGAIASWDAFETAWRDVAARLRGTQGEGLRLLTGPVTSPSQRAQIAGWLRALPRARWHQHLPLADPAADAGARAVHGQPVQAVARFDRARCVVALGSDPFSEGPGCVRQAQDWIAARRAGRAPALFAVEVGPGLFGARADDRIALAPARIDAMVARLAAALLEEAAGGAAADAGASAFEQRLLAALRAAGADVLLLPGNGLSAASHAAVHRIHQRLGAVGRTLDLIAPLATAAEAAPLAQLVADMRAGAVDTLVVLDANPVYDAPADLRFAQALPRVRTSVHAGLYRDETARACGWHLPLSHACEQWGDARAHDGTVTLVQPAILPLYDGRSPLELLALLAGDEERDGYRLLQRFWQQQWGAAFAQRWGESLRAGVVADSAAAPLAASAPATVVAAPVAVPAQRAGLLAAVFTADACAHDGRFSNNAWLQELPRPFTKMTWDNAATIGPQTAATAGLQTGDRVRLVSATGAVDAPVWVDALHAEGAVTLPLGYGRRAAGRVGNRVGFDAYALRPQDAAGATVRIEKLAGARHAFAVTQHSMDPSDREPARSVRAGAAAIEAAPAQSTPSLYPKEEAGEHAWAMVIDLDACIGCNACTIACQAENNIPVVGRAEVARGREMHWIRVDRYATQQASGSIFQPVPCMHCEQAPCEVVCPVGATVHDSEGLNVQVYNRCIGTRFCSNNCPYKVRRFNFLQYTDARTESLKGQRNPNVTVRDRGVMEKCTYCLQRLARARQQSQATGVPLRDGDVVTACQAACPTRAIQFGDLRDPASAVQALRRQPRHYALLEELNTQPRTTYLARVDAGREPT